MQMRWIFPNLSLLQYHIPLTTEISNLIQDHAYFFRSNQPYHMAHDHTYKRNIRDMKLNCSNNHTYIQSLPGNLNTDILPGHSMQYELDIREILKYVCFSCERCAL